MKAVGLLSILDRNPTRLKRIKFLGLLFESHGHTLRIAGGAVRDILRGIEPQDIDFATDALPDKSIEILQKHENLVRIIVNDNGLKHGTVSVKFKCAEIDLKRIKLEDDPAPEKSDSDAKPKYDEESPYEITTLRCDKFTDGRHAQVEFINDWKKDAERRDLTINAMFLTVDRGELIDYFGGESDLKEGKVRFVGDADLRIKEDFLRILRFFRFWSRYSLDKTSIDPDIRTTIQENLPGLATISGERLWTETKKILSYLPCKEVTRVMVDVGIHKYIGLDTPACRNEDYVSSVIERIGIVQDRVKQYSESILRTLSDSECSQDFSLKKMRDLLPAILFASWMPDSDTCLNAHKKLKFSNVERDTILFITENRNTGTSMRGLKHHIVFSKDERYQTMMKIRAFLVYEGNLEAIDELESWEVPTFPISGHIAAAELKKLGLSGKYMRKILDPLKDAWAESDYSLSKQDLEQMMLAKIEDIKSDSSKT